MSNNTPKYPNPKFFKAKDQMVWADQKKNLKEVGSIALDTSDEIVRSSLVCIGGELVHAGAREAMGL